MTKRNEQICQINIMKWMAYQYPDAEKHTYHFANERKCSIKTGWTLKKMGVKRGVSDLFVSIPRHGKNGLWLEIKVNRNNPTPEQKEFMEKQFKNGFAVACCWEFESVKKIIDNYLSSCINDDYFDRIIYEKSV